MINWFINLHPAIQALIGTLFTFMVTCLGAGLVFFFKKINKNIMDAMLGFAGGVMISASFFSLLNPATILAEKLNMVVWIVVFSGFFLGGLTLFIGDKILDFYLKKNENNRIKRTIMLITSITLHNIPEGLVVGVAFGSVIYGIEGNTVLSACLLALGIGLQNFPEGLAVSVPLRREKMSRTKSFIIGSLSGIVEPISGVIGSFLALKVQTILPFLLSFAAGAMIYVVIEEIIPESQTNKRKDLMALFTIIGFSIMLILDIALG